MSQKDTSVLRTGSVGPMVSLILRTGSVGPNGVLNKEATLYMY